MSNDQSAQQSQDEQPRKKRRWGRIIILLLLVIIIGLPVAARFLIPVLGPGIASSQGSKIIGTDFVLGGLSLALIAGQVGLSNITLDAPEGFTEKRIVEVGQVWVDTKPGSLLGDPHVETIALTDILLNVEIDEEGRINMLELPVLKQPGKEKPAPADPGSAEPEPGSDKAKSGAAKKVKIDQFKMSDIAVNLIQAKPEADAARLYVKDVAAEVKQITFPESQKDIDAFVGLKLGQDGNDGKIKLTAAGKPLGDNPEVESKTSFEAIGLAQFMPLAGSDLPILVTKGHVSGELSASLMGDKIQIDLEFGFEGIKTIIPKTSIGKAVKGLGFATVAGFLESPLAAKRMHASLSGSLSDPKFEIWKSLRSTIWDAIFDRAKSLSDVGAIVVKNVTETGEVIVNRVSEETMEAGKKVADQLSKGATAATKKTAETLGVAGDKAGKAAKVTGDAVSKALDKPLKDVGDKLKDVTGEANEGIKKAGDKLNKSLEGIFGSSKKDEE
jgi:hypothetical protein